MTHRSGFVGPGNVRLRRALVGCAVAGALIGITTVRAQPTEEERAPLDEPLELGGPEIELRLGLRAQGARGRDGADRLERDIDTLRAGIRLDLRQRLSTGVQARAEFELRGEQATESGVLVAEEEFEARVRALFVQYESADEGVRVRLGRQGLDDTMGWFIDEDVDGLRIGIGGERRRLDLSLSREAPFEDGDRQDDQTLNALAALSFDTGRKSDWTPWVLHRSGDGSDGGDDADTTWFGLQGVGRTTDRLRYWFNAAARRGEENRDDGTTRDLAGHAFDLGLVRIFQTAWRPSLALGFASATGDAERGDGDDGFRQTGLHDNEHRFGGEFDFRYLGEVLDPELANIEIVTFGVGAKTTPDLSLDVVYHRYRQRETEDRLRGTDLQFDPTGASDDLGDGLDLVIGYDTGGAFELQAVAGLFRFGEAFRTVDSATPDDAWLLRLEMEYTFAVR